MMPHGSGPERVLATEPWGEPRSRNMLKRETKIPHVYLPIMSENILLGEHITVEIDRNPVGQWERQLAEFLKKLPLHERHALKSVVELLQEQGRRLTQTQLLGLARNRPRSELDE